VPGAGIQLLYRDLLPIPSGAVVLLEETVLLSLPLSMAHRPGCHTRDPEPEVVQSADETSSEHEVHSTTTKSTRLDKLQVDIVGLA
jgi:uncharacterized metal-binding protein YceD (DUF177 family)